MQIVGIDCPLAVVIKVASLSLRVVDCDNSPASSAELEDAAAAGLDTDARCWQIDIKPQVSLCLFSALSTRSSEVDSLAFQFIRCDGGGHLAKTSVSLSVSLC